ncbi:MAG: Tat pathway signal protein [Bacteroidetes bacterium]|nr:MAG: Tat pathway signal protein [Bacteroidota bacterium]
MRIKGSFLDEISHDIPHQNWGEKEWDADFGFMKAAGIDTVILIRSGYRKWMTYPSAVLMEKEGCYAPPVDLVGLFLRLAEKHEMDFYFGLYDSGNYWLNGLYREEVELNKLVIDEVWARYGHYKRFKGWYLSQECSRKVSQVVELYASLGRHCKEVSGGLPTLISPYIDGIKNLSQYDGATARNESVSLLQHEEDWDEIFAGISGAVDIVAFQDGHVGYDELTDFLMLNKKLADKHGLECWTNSETFDRDMPIKFLPIKWEKLKRKLDLAAKAGITNAITFEFSHFMSPQSAYLQAGHLYNRYMEYITKVQ